MSGCLSTKTILLLLVSVLLSVQGNTIDGHGEDNIGATKEMILEKFKSAPNSEIGEMAKLEILLMKSWKEMNKMLYCTKTPKCVKNYLKNIQT